MNMTFHIRALLTDAAHPSVLSKAVGEDCTACFELFINVEAEVANNSEFLTIDGRSIFQDYFFNMKSK